MKLGVSTRGPTIVMVWLSTVAAFLLAACAPAADRNDAGEVVASGQIDIFQTKIGDCFDDQSQTDSIDDVPGRPCLEPHDNEVFALFDTSLTSFPGEDEMFDHAIDECMTRFEDYVGEPYDSSVLDIFPIVPTLESWKRVNDREIICALYHIEGEKLVGSMKGSGI